MQITRLRLAGFKSFVDPADLRIEPGLTGVVGPNGCGKSNLLEALRWVMGENSPRSMRGAGMEDVIFAGTARRPARDFAEVSILTEAQGDETEVVRRIERGAGSAYRIDGRDVRARDVALLFADAATGAHSPALVSQGRIGAVIAARPVDRRQMLEEAAGIAGLHVRRRDAEQKLRATETNLARLDELIADQSARAAALRRQARQAERYRELSARIRTAEAQLIFARWREADAAAIAARVEAARCEAQVFAAAETQREAAAIQSAAAQAVIDARTAALTARDRANDAGYRLSRLRDELLAAERRIAEMAEARQRIVADRAREGTLAHDAADALARLADEARALTANIAAGEAVLPALERSHADAEAHARDAEVALAQALGRQASEIADSRVAQAALAAARARLERADRELAQLDDALATLEEPGKLEAEYAMAQAALAQDVHAAAEAEQRIVAAERNQQTAHAEHDGRQRERADALAELTAAESESKALTRATQRSGRDRLLDHVRAEPGYERALAAALGDDLELGLDAAADAYWQGAERVSGDPPAPAGAVALGDHVAAPSALARRLAQIFVVDADDDRPLASGQRMVTRGGHMRRWDGLVVATGGAVVAERLERVNRLAAIEDHLPALRARAEATDAALKATERTMAGARETLAGARALLATTEAAQRANRQRLDRSLALLERMAGQRADLDVRRRRVLAERADAADDTERAVHVAADLPDTAAMTALVTALQRAADERRTAVAQTRAERTTHDRMMTAARERLAAGTADLLSWKARAGDAARRIADMAARDAALTGEAEKLAAQPSALRTALATLSDTHAELRAAADTSAATERTAVAASRAAEERLRQAGEALSQMREARAGAAARADNADARRAEFGRVAGERFESPAPLLPERIGFDPEQTGSSAEELSGHERLILERERIGPVNLVAESELAEIDQDTAQSTAERDELAEAVNRLRHSIGTLNREGRQRLLAAFEAVDAHFRRLFTTLFAGGEAHLALIDSDDPLEAGLEIMAQPPGKKLQSLTLLSGGEQALTAVALIFGLFLTNPAPVCVLDEVDAPLDDANIERFCDLLDAMTRDTRTRYLIVTHNAVTMSRMHRLFGVTMVEPGISRLVSVDLETAAGLVAE